MRYLNRFFLTKNPKLIAVVPVVKIAADATGIILQVLKAPKNVESLKKTFFATSPYTFFNNRSHELLNTIQNLNFNFRPEKNECS